MAHDNHHELGGMVSDELAELTQCVGELSLGLQDAVVDDQLAIDDAGPQVEGPHTAV